MMIPAKKCDTTNPKPFIKGPKPRTSELNESIDRATLGIYPQGRTRNALPNQLTPIHSR